MPKYMGHRSWNAWNVSLWLNNDERLYEFALTAVQRSRNRTAAAKRILSALGGSRTPDGGRFNLRSIYEALEGFEGYLGA